MSGLKKILLLHLYIPFWLTGRAKDFDERIDNANNKWNKVCFPGKDEILVNPMGIHLPG